MRVNILYKTFTDERRGTRLYQVKTVEVDAGVVGKDPGVSGSFRHEGESPASSPPPGIDERFARLVEAVKINTSLKRGAAVTGLAVMPFGY